METRNKRRLRFLLKYCSDLTSAQLAEIWWVFQEDERRSLKEFGEWALTLSMLKLKSLQSHHKRFLEQIEEIKAVLLNLPNEDLESLGKLNPQEFKKEKKPIEVEPLDDWDEEPYEELPYTMISHNEW